MSERLSRTQSSSGRPVSDLLSVKTDDPVRLRRGRLVNLVLLVTLAVMLLWLVVAGALALFSTSGAPVGGAIGRAAFFALILGVTYALNRRSASPMTGLILALTALAGSVVALVASGPLTTSVIGLTLPVLIAGLLGPPTSAFLLATMAALAYGWLNVQRNPAYLPEFARDSSWSGTFIVYLNLYIIAALAWLFSRMAGRAIRESHAELQALAGRQRELEARLERQTLQLRATTSVARALAGSRELDVLLRDMVKLVREYFQHDPVQIFLIDDAGEYAVLRASTSGAARRLLASGHKLPIKSMSAVGQAADRGEAVIAGETHVDLLLQRVEHSPDIRSEVAVPLVVGESVVGVLQMQSSKPDAFDASALPALQALADQLAISIANARLYEEAQRNLRELSQLGREATRRGWREYLSDKGEEDRVYRYGPSDPARAGRQNVIVARVMETGEVVSAQTRAGGIPGYLAVPMMLRDEAIGVVGVEVDEERHWTQDDMRIMQGIAERITLAVENARLFEQAHRTAQREQLVNTIASRLQGAPDMHALLEGAAAELSRALSVDQVYAEFALHGRPVTDSRPGPSQDSDGNVGTISPDGKGSSEQLDVGTPENADGRGRSR